MQAEDHLPVRWTVINVVHAQFATIRVWHLDVVGCERMAGETGESTIRGAQRSGHVRLNWCMFGRL